MRRLKVTYGDNDVDIVPCQRFTVESSGALVLYSDKEALIGISAYAPGVWGMAEWEEMGR